MMLRPYKHSKGLAVAPVHSELYTCLLPTAHWHPSAMSLDSNTGLGCYNSVNILYTKLPCLLMTLLVVYSLTSSWTREHHAVGTPHSSSEEATCAAASWSASMSSSITLRVLPWLSMARFCDPRAAQAECRSTRSRPSLVPYAIPPPCKQHMRHRSGKSLRAYTQSSLPHHPGTSLLQSAT